MQLSLSVRTIAWDVDDVLNDLMREWFTRAWLPAHPRCMVTYDALSANPPHEILGATREEYLRSLDAFRLQHARSLAPSAIVRAWLEANGTRYRHLALTATPLHTAPISAAWVMEHFGRWIRTFAVIPSPRAFDTSPKYDASKSDYLACSRRSTCSSTTANPTRRTCSIRARGTARSSRPSRRSRCFRGDEHHGSTEARKVGSTA